MNTTDTAALKVGDRVSSKRAGCDRTHGTVVKVLDAPWVRVLWDSGNSCMWEAYTLEIRDGRRYVKAAHPGGMGNTI